MCSIIIHPPLHSIWISCSISDYTWRTYHKIFTTSQKHNFSQAAIGKHHNLGLKCLSKDNISNSLLLQVTAGHRPVASFAAKQIITHLQRF